MKFRIKRVSKKVCLKIALMMMITLFMCQKKHKLKEGRKESFY